MQTNRRAAFRIAGAYAAVSVAWILLSDSFVALFPHRIENSLQTGKGLLFVVITTATLYVVVSRFAQQIGLATSRAASTERLLSQVVATVPVGVVMTNGEGLITFFNPGAEELLGLTGPEAVGRTLDEIFPYDDPSRAAPFGELLRTGAHDGIELSYGGDRPKRVLLARATELDPAVPGTGWIIALADITDSHQTAIRMRRLASGYRFLTESALAMAKCTTQRSLLEGQSRLGVDAGGYTGAWATLRDPATGAIENLGVHGLEPLSGGVAQRLTERFDMAPAVVMDRMRSGEIYVNNDLARDNVTPWAEAAASEGFGSAAAMAFEVGGEVIATLTLFAAQSGHFDADELAMLRSLRGALSFALDRLSLDERRFVAEEALTASERAYRAIFDTYPAPVLVFDRETLAFLAVNDAAVSRYGYSKDGFLGLTLSDIRPHEGIPEMRVLVANMDDRVPDIGVHLHSDREGHPFKVHIVRRPVTWEGRPAVIAVATPVEDEPS